MLADEVAHDVAHPGGRYRPHVRIEEDRAHRRRARDLVAGKIVDEGMAVREDTGGAAQDGLGVAVGDDDVFAAGRGQHRDRADREDELHVRFDAVQPRHHGFEIIDDLAVGQVEKAVTALIPDTAPGARGRGKHRAVLDPHPGFGHAEREHEDVRLFDKPSDASEMVSPQDVDFVLAVDRSGLDIGTERIDEATVAGPSFVQRVAISESPLDQLQPLPRRIDVAVTGRVDAIAVIEVQIGRQKARRGLDIEIGIALALDLAPDMLREAAPGRGHPPALERKLLPVPIVDLERVRLLDGAVPEGAVGLIAIRMLGCRHGFPAVSRSSVTLARGLHRRAKTAALIARWSVQDGFTAMPKIRGGIIMTRSSRTSKSSKTASLSAWGLRRQ